jgi:hypothetical protein
MMEPQQAVAWEAGQGSSLLTRLLQALRALGHEAADDRGRARPSGELEQSSPGAAHRRPRWPCQPRALRSGRERVLSGRPRSLQGGSVGWVPVGDLGCMGRPKLHGCKRSTAALGRIWAATSRITRVNRGQQGTVTPHVSAHGSGSRN